MEQGYPDVIMILPAAETFNFYECLMIYWEKCEKMHAALDWEVMFKTEFSTWKLKNASFFDLKRPACRARQSGRDYDTPSC